MNSKIYRQADSRWGSLPYPTKAYSFAGNGCGCCACTHNIIEIPKYANYTPADVRPYMVGQGFATKGHGTTWDGITKTLQHYGFTVAVPNINSSMTPAWTYLNKPGAPKQGVLLFRGGSRGGVRWTNGGHYVAFLDYRVTNGKHYFYTKDSGGRHHDGWYCYETTMRGLLPKIWIVTAKPNSPAPTPTPPKPKSYKLTVDGKWGKQTTITTQHIFGLKEDGICGKATWKAIQKKVGTTADGVEGKNTIKAMQKFLNAKIKAGLKVDGKRGTATNKAWQKWCNTQVLPQ